MLPAIFQDAHMVVVNKPWNMLSVPGKPSTPRPPRVEEWQRACVETHRLTDLLPTSQCADVLRRIAAKPENVPRKENKFYGYMKRSFGVLDDDVLKEAWGYLNIVDKQLNVPPTNFTSPMVSATEILRHTYTKVLNAHRLDCETSGVLVFALSEDACAALSRQFREGECDKRYIAVVSGHVDSALTEVCAPIGPDVANRPKQVYTWNRIY
jgi:23S rRNA-/tRNA-specific pseudouridylate synthase